MIGSLEAINDGGFVFLVFLYLNILGLHGKLNALYYTDFICPSKQQLQGAHLIAGN